ncbi:MAG: SdiA-regulated domain-containing protein [Bacteroidales bacterium]|nr:SdiA-regulated domain-containing protein [Bacteroidales bacterium]MBN2757607.1 SdiA-regulated domain-containing protein [Bacteroidales bacterium]
MKSFILALLFSTLFITCNNAQENTEELENNEIYNLKLIKNNPYKQFKTLNDKRFDLSGITSNGKDIFIIADKEYNNKIYKIDTTTNNFRILSEIELCTTSKIDYEGIDFYNNHFYIIEEWENDIYKTEPTSCKLEKIDINWKSLNIDDSDWGNKGLEGIAIDCENDILYIAKERQPRRVFSINLKTNEISEPFKDIFYQNEEGYDISDMKFENKYLYILERSKALVTRLDIKTKETKSVSFNTIVYNNGKRIYANKSPQYGMGEALLLSKNQIWIGLDNNGDMVSEYGKSLGLEQNTKTVILIFERPDWF